MSLQGVTQEALSLSLIPGLGSCGRQASLSVQAGYFSVYDKSV